MDAVADGDQRDSPGDEADRCVEQAVGDVHRDRRRWVGGKGGWGGGAVLGEICERVASRWKCSRSIEFPI
jgi:hypothetical protein